MLDHLERRVWCFMNSYLLCGYKEESIDHLSLSQDKDFMAVDAFFV